MIKAGAKLVLSLILISGCNDSSVETIEIEQNKLTANGELISQNTVTISPPSVDYMWQYKIKFIARENTQVKKGDVVLKFDDQELQIKLIEKQSELQAEIKSAEQKQLELEQEEQDLKLRLAEAKMNYEKELRKTEIVDVATTAIKKRKQQKQFEIAKLSLEQVNQKLAYFYEYKALSATVNEGKVNNLQTQVEKIKADINKLTVKSPKQGIVMYVARGGDDKPAVGETVWQGRSLLTIPSLDDLTIQAQFDEPDSSKLHENQTVKVTFDAFPELPIIGEIDSLGQSYKKKSHNNPKVVFDVLISVDNVDKNILRPGMNAKVELIEEQG